MDENRPAKWVIRSLWLEEVKSVAQRFPNSPEPWYLTLGGAEGYDIQLIIEKRLISLTEVNSIAERDQHRIVAVERNNRAIAALQSKFIGLRIKEVDFGDLLRGDSQFNWPQGEDFKCCRARVVNLDFDVSLSVRDDNGQIVFPILEWIRKLCRIHERQPRINWTLCLTLNGDVAWPEDVSQRIKNFFSENIRREPIFEKSCKEFFREKLFKIAVQSNNPDLTKLDREGKQKFLMVVVPKMITKLVHNEGWRVHTEYNLRYGGSEQAPMVTWIIKFTWDGGGMATPDAIYRAALRNIFSGIGIVTDKGKIEKSS
jgi:hypothetical protein